MAELAGLVLGAAGLAGLIGAFKDVVDLYSLFVDSTHLGRDYEILDTKLDIEKTMLLHWADRVGLLRTDYDPRLDALKTRESVFRTLGCIRTLLGDASQLESKYGVQTFSFQELEIASSSCATVAAPENTHRAISGRRMAHLTRELGKIRLRRLIPEHASLKHKFRWAVRDKQQFETLIQDLSHFTTKLEGLIPAAFPSSLTQSDLQPIQDLRGLKLVLEASLGLGRSPIADTAQEAIDKKCQERILDMLWFRTMKVREDEVKPAHAETMDWALQPPNGDDQWDDLSEWLRSGEGIYWVSGKAGSGKSTLMKRLVQHPRTQDLLLQWAGGDSYNLASFFFWYHGTAEQQSQEGLSRSLLHQILSQHPSAVPKALPGMWKELSRNTGDQVSLPSLTETRHAFQMLASPSLKLGKFCFFIDGLDEFTGDYREAIAFIKNLTANPGLKVVVASRHIPECSSGFDGCPGLRLQDLTRRDIAKYVDDIIGGHKYMRKLLARYPTQAQRLRDELVDKSSGVFLWVVLACRSLLSGFADCDQIADLQRRVAELPQELEDMFRLMLSKIDKRHREQGAFMLRVCYALDSVPQNDRLRTFMLQYPTTFGLAMLVHSGDDQHYANSYLPVSAAEKRELCEDFSGWLTSRCGGLLEVTQPRSDGYETGCFCEAADFDSHDHLVDSHVVWMHRSVFEFLQDNKVWELESLQVDRSWPSASAALSLYGLYLGVQTMGSIRDGAWSDFLVYSGVMGARADAEDPADRSNSFWRMGPAVEGIFGALGKRNSLPPQTPTSTGHQEPSEAITHWTLLLAAEFGAVNYLKTHLKGFKQGHWNEPGVSCGCFCILDHAVRRHLLFSLAEYNPRDLWAPSKSVISLFLASGVDPNVTRHVDGPSWDAGYTLSPWAAWLDHAASAESSDTADVTVMFLVAGADPTDDCFPAWIQEFLLDETNWDKLTVPRSDLLQAIKILRGMKISRAVSEPDLAGSTNLTDSDTVLEEEAQEDGDGVVWRAGSGWLGGWLEKWWHGGELRNRGR